MTIHLRLAFFYFQTKVLPIPAGPVKYICKRLLYLDNIWLIASVNSAIYFILALLISAPISALDIFVFSTSSKFIQSG